MSLQHVVFRFAAQNCQAWNDLYEVPVARACLQEACARQQGAWVPKKSLSLALLCLAEACRREAAFEALKPNLQQLLEHGIFPQVRFGEEELQLWQEDPEELIRELLSESDSSTQPHQAAIELVERLLLYHHKEILLPLLQFCHRHLETEAKDAAACSNQDGALVLLGLMAEYLVELDPLQSEVKARKRKGKSKAQHSVSIEELISRYVRPAMTSQAGFLRLRGAWCLGRFAHHAPKLGRPGVAGGATCDCVRMLGDKELPVRVVAASCLEDLLSREDQEVHTAVGLQLAPAMEQLLVTLADVQSEDVASALQRLVENFPQEVVPFALQLAASLARQFGSAEMSNKSEKMSAESTLSTIISVLQACAGLQRGEPILGPHLRRTHPRAQWVLDKAMSLPLRIFVRDVQKGGRRVVAVPRNGACSVARFSQQKLGEARLTIDGFTIPSWECASQVFRDGDAVDILPEAASVTVDCEGKDPSSRRQEKEPPTSCTKDIKPKVKRPRAGFLTADLRRKLFGEARAEAESVHAHNVSPEEVEEPRSRVGLRLVSEAVDGWQTVLKDEGRRSFAAHRAQALSKDTAQRFLEQAMRDVNWQQPEGTWGPIPRKTSWMTRAPCCCRYGYGGLRMEPEPMAPWLLETMELCMPLCGISKEDWPDSCNLNLYESGDHSVGWHSDDEFLFQGKFQDCLIISLSLGASRCFELKTMSEPVQMQRLVLHGGDLCTMEGMLQKHYLHRVPKEHSTSPRVNLTWRWVKCHERRCSQNARDPGGPFESRDQPLHESGEGRKRAASTSGQPWKKQKIPLGMVPGDRFA
eukprot:s2677_g5.t1